ncbi:MAG: hypothetical protein CME19_07820 [Gemmatimonadetes bacterium]|nr:hypothetical protein [Gemmatimonadota bacterium]
MAALVILVGFAVAEGQPASPINVLLITVDTFRADRLSGYGHDRLTSPSLDALAADGALFEQAFSSSSWTTPGLMSVLTGQSAPSHGVDVRGKSLRPGSPTFATELAKAGYVTPDILYLSSIPNFQNIGLTETYEERDKHLPNGDEVLFKALEAYQDSTFFLYYHYRNLHLPYNPSPPYDTLYTEPGFDLDGFVRKRVDVVRENVTIPVGTVTFAGSDSAWIYGLYDGQIKQMDETFFKPLVAHLKTLDLYERTMIIVTADHGEELLEHGFIGHPSTSFKGAAYDELIRQPMMMTCPPLIQPIRLSQQVQNVDILPTALELLGLPIPETVEGRSLVPLLKGGRLPDRPVFTETTQGGYQSTPAMMRVRVRAHREPPWKLIHTLGPGIDRYELYHLEQDPGELRDVSAAHPEVLSRMRQTLHAWAVSTAREVESPIPDGAAVHTGPIRVAYPADGDTLRYVDAEMTVDLRWTGTDNAAYAVDYDVGEGNYSLDGRIPVIGLVSSHGPFTEEMWNMLTLYNPYAFRIVAEESGAASDWVRFTISPTSADVRPNLSVRMATVGAHVLSEARILVSGLWMLLGVAVEAAGGHLPSDVMGWGLVVVLLGAAVFPPVFRRLGTPRASAWGLVVLYSGLIYSTLSLVPELWGLAFRLTLGRIDLAATLLGIGAAVWVAIRIVKRRLGWQRLAAVAVLGCVYAYLILWLSQSPAERFHLAEYGLLSFLTYRAARLDLDRTRSVVVGLVTASLIGAGDECIQWALPNRVFEWKDIWLNVGSSALGMVLVLLLVEETDRA